MRNKPNTRSVFFSRALAVLCVLGASSVPWGDAGAAGPELQTGVAMRSWSIDWDDDEVDVSQLSVPVLLKSPLGADGLGVTLFIAGARSEVDGSDLAKLGAATDTELKFDYLMPNERVLLSGGASLPTGDTEFDEEGVVVSRAVSNQILGFRTNRYGEGFDYFGDVALAYPVSQTISIGAGAGFRYKGKYDFAPETSSALLDFDPGEEIFVSGGMSYLGREGTATTTGNMDITFRTYAEDEIVAEPVFQEGDEFEVRVTGSRRGERWSGGGMLRLVDKSDHEFLGDSELLAFGSPVEDVLLGNVTAGVLQVSFSLGFRVTPAVTLTAFAHSSRFQEVVVAAPSGGDDLIRRGKAAAHEPGLSLAWRARDAFTVHLTGSGLRGWAEDGDITIAGYDVSAGVAIGR
ncbi:MAG: hypothetical protein HKN20_03750 [Gemmatimonadetes bacterium]|nr:hypothetical protein [Gemmatimonadota bacterium]